MNTQFLDVTQTEVPVEGPRGGRVSVTPTKRDRYWEALAYSVNCFIDKAFLIELGQSPLVQVEEQE